MNQTYQAWRELTLAQVWPEFLAEKSQEIGPTTLGYYKEYFRTLKPFFGDLLLRDIRITHIVTYRASRVTAGPGLINHEINVIQQILNKAGLWMENVGQFFKQLRVPKTGPGQAFLPEEAAWLIDVARMRKKWQTAYLCSLISANTACGPGEIRKLRLRDVDLLGGIINVVEGAKNKYRVRPVPLNSEARWAVEQLMEIALEKGSHKPDHYLLPARPKRLKRDPNERCSTNKAHADPTRPVLSWRKAWYALRAEAGKKYPKLLNIRIYDLRHHALTSLLEDPNISEETVKSIAGHVSQKILQRYSHIRIAEKRTALAVLEGLRPRPVGEKKVAPERRPPAPVALEDPLEILQQANRKA